MTGAGRPFGNRRSRLRAGAPAAAVALLLAACATAASLRDARGMGPTRDFEGSFEEVWQAAVESVRALGISIDRANEEERWIAATRHPSGPGPGAPEEAVSVQADQGERVGVFVDSVALGRWRVEVVTLRLFALDPAKIDWSEDIFFSMALRLDPGSLRIPDSAVQEPPER